MKRSTHRALKKGERLFRRRRYSLTISFLEPQVFLFRENYRYYYLLGMSCLYTGDYAGAHSYLRRAVDLRDEPAAHLGLAAVLLRRRQIDDALRVYLDIIDADNKNPRARRALSWLRNVESPDDVIVWFEERRIHRILPPRGVAVPPWVAVVFAGILAALLTGFFVFVLLPPLLDSRRGDQRPGSELLTVTRNETVLMDEEENGNDDSSPVRYRVTLTEREAQELLRTIGNYFNEGRDNMVRRELNRLALSNASRTVRQRGDQLRDFLQSPDFTTMRDSFAYREVVGDPALHEGVFVRWRGRLANLAVSPERIRFDLLVGYHRGEVLEGIVPVELQFAALLEPDQAVEVIGVVTPDPRGHITMQGTRIRILAPGELAD